MNQSQKIKNLRKVAKILLEANMISMMPLRMGKDLLSRGNDFAIQRLKDAGDRAYARVNRAIDIFGETFPELVEKHQKKMNRRRKREFWE